MVPEGTKTMGSLAPGPEDTAKQDYRSRYLAGTTHNLETIPCRPSNWPSRSAQATLSLERQAGYLMDLARAALFGAR